MRCEEVLPALREGKKIRREDKVWKNYYGFLFISETENEIFSDSVRDYYYKITKDDLNADDWEIVKEPKKVKLKDLTEEQYETWLAKNCHYTKCVTCPFSKVKCDLTSKNNWINNKDI